jgi:hypothetical protein
MLDQNMPRPLAKGEVRVVLGAQHTAHGRLLPNREALLDAMPKQAVVAEIGVSAGDFTAQILARCDVRRLHLVDAWEGPRYASDLDVVQRRFAEAIASSVVEIDQGLSETVLATFPDAYFDWVYIDSDHSYDVTARELDICRRKVKLSGMIAGHDFCKGNILKRLPYGVIEAVNEFCVAENWAYAYLTLESHGHFSFCIRPL